MTQKATESVVVQPGSTIGILGSGQLGRMMAIAAKQMGYRVHVFSSSQDSPAGQVADVEVVAAFDDLDAVRDFAEQVDVVTVETENIPLETLDVASAPVEAFPSRIALETCQNRGLEKQFLSDNGIPTPEFRIIRSLDELQAACSVLMPAVLKTITGGYDGKGQAVIRPESDIEEVWRSLNADEAILEQWIEYDFEFSVVGARDYAGSMTAYPSIRNDHQNGILDVSTSPSGLDDKANNAAIAIVHKIMDKLKSVGVLTVEFFNRNGEILVNEIAPRPHNSGHLTLEGHMTSQFEQHVRTVCGLTAGSTEQIRPVAMANLLGDEWSNGTPNWDLALSVGNTKLHLYGKEGPRQGRKMAHLTSIADSPEEARDNVLEARLLLSSTPAELAETS